MTSDLSTKDSRPARFSLRDVQPSDNEFLYLLYRQAREYELAGVGWDEEQIDAFLRMQFAARSQAYALQTPNAAYSLIYSNGELSGSVAIDRRTHEIVLIDIAVDAAHRRKGIAAAVIADLQSEALDKGVPLVLRVEKTNAAAIFLYRKLGFRIVAQTPVLFAMEWPYRVTHREVAVELRPVEDTDREFLISAYEASREMELSMTPWSPEQKRLFATHQFDAQLLHYAKTYSQASHDIILADGREVGRLFVNRGTAEIAIVDLTVLAEARNRGIASSLIEKLQSESGETGRKLRVYVERFNPSQHFFFKRGFEVSESDDVYLILRWQRSE